MNARVVASENGAIGLESALDVLTSGGTAIDAVVAALSMVEANPDDHSVGYSGLPNMLGEVELDASVMAGDGLRAGSVAALKGYQEAAQLAQTVMDDLPHVLIAGDGASRLAAEAGFEPRTLLTPEGEAIWRSKMGPDGETPALDDFQHRMREIVESLTSDPQLVEDSHGTVNVICQDRAGRIASGVSTSGWAWKYPGRVGDSPIIGAGNYCDDRYGAATCTGHGELALRACTAHSVVMFMRFGMEIERAVKTALEDLANVDFPYAGEMNIVALSVDGAAHGASTVADRRYVYQEEGMGEPQVRPRVVVPLRS